MEIQNNIKQILSDQNKSMYSLADDLHKAGFYNSQKSAYQAVLRFSNDASRFILLLAICTSLGVSPRDVLKLSTCQKIGV